MPGAAVGAPLTGVALCGLGDEIQDVVGRGRPAPGKLLRRRGKRERARPSEGGRWARHERRVDLPSSGNIEKETPKYPPSVLPLSIVILLQQYCTRRNEKKQHSEELGTSAPSSKIADDKQETGGAQRGRTNATARKHHRCRHQPSQPHLTRLALPGGPFEHAHALDVLEEQEHPGRLSRKGLQQGAHVRDPVGLPAEPRHLRLLRRPEREPEERGGEVGPQVAPERAQRGELRCGAVPCKGGGGRRAAGGRKGRGRGAGGGRMSAHSWLGLAVWRGGEGGVKRREL